MPESLSPYEDKGHFRRQYPRRALKRKVGVLCDGSYIVCDTAEIGEGGMAIRSDFVLTEGHEIVLSFQVPQGEFVSLRGVVRSTQTSEGKKMGDSRVTHGLSFSNVPFAIKRQIRAFVSARTKTESL